MKARHRQLYQDQIYHSYVAEALKNISENVAKGMGIEGAVYMAKSLSEIMNPSKNTNVSAEEIINRIKRKLRECE